jgi:AraC-like DNA-binding protein
VVIKQFAPSAALAPYIRAYEIIETQDAVTRTLLPDTCIIIGFRYAGSARLLNDERMRAPLPNVCVTGLRTSVREMHTTANSGIILAKFRAAGAAPFFREPLHQLFGATCPLRSLNADVADDDTAADDATGDDAAARIRAIVNASSDDERVARVEHFLLTRHRPIEPHAMVSAALRAIAATAGGIRVRKLAADLGVSQDSLEKHFRRIVGASPKQFATIVRLRQAVELSRQSPSLTALALDAGYYDQSHFIRDFRAITGDAPGHFFQHARFC